MSTLKLESKHIMVKDSVKAFSALEDAVEIIGGRPKLADKINESGAKVSRSAVANWKKVPIKYVRIVSKLTGISHKDLLPEIDFL